MDLLLISSRSQPAVPSRPTRGAVAQTWGVLVISLRYISNMALISLHKMHINITIC